MSMEALPSCGKMSRARLPWKTRTEEAGLDHDLDGGPHDEDGGMR